MTRGNVDCKQPGSFPFSHFIRSVIFSTLFVCYYNLSLNAFTFMFNFMTISDVDALLVEYKCSVSIAFATLDGEGTGMEGSVSNIFVSLVISSLTYFYK